MKILLVEDSKRLQESLQKAFKNMGYAVDFAMDGEEGLWLAQNNDYDVIILDMMLPKMDGATVLKKLRDSDKKTPVLILSAKDTMDDKVGGLNIGADDYLTKPFALEELTARINAVEEKQIEDINGQQRAWIDVGKIFLRHTQYRSESGIIGQ